MARTTLRRTGRLAPVSGRRRNERDRRREVRERVFARDGWACILTRNPALLDRLDHPCWGPVTLHHLRKAGQGGGYTEANAVTLCAGHNTWVEDHPAVAYQLGLVIRAGDTTEDAWRRLRTNRLT